MDFTTWTSHKGSRHPLHSMNVFHLQGAMKKLQAQHAMLTRVCSGEDPHGLRAFLSDPHINPWVPIWTPEELLERTALWILAIEQELNNRREAEIHGFHH